MTYARAYQHGMKAYVDGAPLDGNPYDPALCPETCEAWSDGWLDASRARGRIHAYENGARLTGQPAPSASTASL